jgi:lysophospholipase L1-like esterase
VVIATATYAAPKRTPKKKAAPVSARARAEAQQRVDAFLARQAPIENAAALVPFFEMLARAEKVQLEHPLRILHYGDSHTAADEWTGTIRSTLQARFGDGGGGYSYAGRPWNSYRRVDLRGGGTRGWYSDGLVGRAGDGLNGLGGVSITASQPRQRIYLDAECRRLEVFFLQQPGGGAFRLYDNDHLVEEISTGGELAPGYFAQQVEPGWHRFELETVNRAPVRLFGWVTENDRGVTYETLGINGAQASIVFRWDEDLLRDNIAHRDPGLIVLAYGTNEASSKDWTEDSYREMFTALIRRFREAAPAASILVVGPPDRFIRIRGRWQALAGIARIVRAQRDAALAEGCAFQDLRGRMGGPGSMHDWVLAGLAQPDHVHFTALGYRMLAANMAQELLTLYAEFARVRNEPSQVVSDGQANQNP